MQALAFYSYFNLKSMSRYSKFLLLTLSLKLILEPRGLHWHHEEASLRRLQYKCGPWTTFCCQNNGRNMSSCKKCNAQCLSSGNLYGSSICNENGADCGATIDCSKSSKTTTETRVFYRRVGTVHEDLASFFFPATETNGCKLGSFSFVSCNLIYDFGVN